MANYYTWDYPEKGFSAAASGEAFFVWQAFRESYLSSGILGVFDTDDFDRDQHSKDVDCNDEDPGAWANPAVLSHVRLDKIERGGIRIAWDSQAESAGPGTAYDLVKGLLSELHDDGDFSRTSCLLDNGQDPFIEYTSVDPPAGDGEYFLGRAENSCDTSSHGDSTMVPDPRDNLDSSGPCP
jgi:hypothetical protein